jgi:hypothetical protein
MRRQKRCFFVSPNQEKDGIINSGKTQLRRGVELWWLLQWRK